MAKDNKTHNPSCPWRAPPVTLARAVASQPKQACARRGDGEGWPAKRDLRGGYRPSGAREVMAASKPITAIAYEVAKKKTG